jgi:hypothetical protein
MESQLVTFLVIVGVPVLLSFLITRWSGQKIVTWLPASYMLVALWVLSFGMLNKLHLGVILIAPALLLVICVTIFAKRESLRIDSIKELTSIPMILFVSLAAWTFLHSQQMKFYLWDEFSGWGPFVKSMFLFDALGPYSPAKIGFPEYLSGISILPYLTVKIGGTWDEADVYWSYQLLIIAILVSALGLLQWKKHALNLLVISTSILTVTFYYSSFSSIYADPLLGLLFGLGVVVGTSKDIGRNRWTLFNFTVIVCFISTAKEIGFIFSFILIILMVIVNLVGAENIKSSKYRAVFKTFLLGLITVIPVLIVKFAWETVLSNQMVSTNRSILSVLNELLFEGAGENKFYRDELTSNFLNKTLVQPLTNLSGYPLTVVAWVFTLTLIWIVLIRSLVTRDEKFREISIYATIVFGVLGYLGALWLSYLIVFSSGEGVGTASYERYVFTYFLGILFYFNFRFVQLVYVSSAKFELSMFSSVWIVFLMLQSSPAHFLSYLSSPSAASNNYMAQFNDQRKMIKDMKLTVEDDVWIISQHTQGFEYYFLKYELLPASVGPVPWSIGSAYSEGDIWTDTKITAEKWNDLLDEYDYVYVNKATESYINEFGSLYEDPDSMTTPGFYKVVHNGNGNVLVRINN